MIGQASILDFDNRARSHFDHLISPDTSILDRLAERLSRCELHEVAYLHLQVAEALHLPAEIVVENERPIIKLGTIGNVIIISDCLTPVDNTETILRGEALSINCWGHPAYNLVPCNKVSFYGVPHFLTEPASFSLASFLALHETNRAARHVQSGPTFVALNSALRSPKYPDGAPFILGLCKGNVLVLGTGLEVFSYAKAAGFIVGDKLWEIDMADVIARNSLYRDVGTHYRSKFMSNALADFATGYDIITKTHSIDDIPDIYKSSVEAGEKITTKLLDIDGFHNIKTALTKEELLAASFGGKKLRVEINGVELRAKLASEIVAGDEDCIVIVPGSSWHTFIQTGDLSRDVCTSNFVDLFVRGKHALEMFRDKKGNLPMLGSKIEIYVKN